MNRIKNMMDRLANGEYLIHKRNNEILLGFLNAKIEGHIGRIVYPKPIGEKTAEKLAVNLKKIEQCLNKPFDQVSMDDINEFRDQMNRDEIKANITKVHHTSNGVKTTIEQGNKPLSYRTKTDYKKNFSALHEFIREIYYLEHKNEINSGKKQELTDITRFWHVRKPEDYQDVVVDFIPNDELQVLLSKIRNPDFLALVQLSLMSGARPCEILKVKYGRRYNLYTNSEGKWVIQLPRIKGISYKKFPFVIDMYEDNLYPYFNNLSKSLKSGDYVFKFKPSSFRKLMEHYTEYNLGKVYSPKILRKTARMIRSNAGYPHDWINKLMGHAPGSQIQGHYTNYEGIEDDPIANDKMKAKQFPSLKSEHDAMKLKLQAQERKMDDQRREFEERMRIMEMQIMRQAEKEIAGS